MIESIIAFIFGNKQLSLGTAIGTALIFKYRNYLLVNIVAYVAPKIYTYCFESLIIHTNLFFENKKASSSYSEVWAELEKRLIVGLKKLVETLER